MSLQIKYNKNIVSGQFLTPKQTSFKPDVSLNGLDTNKKYTLIMYDPNSVFGNHIHWTISNIQGNNFSSGKTIFQYGGPTPPKGSGIHNYTFSLYESDNIPLVKSFDQSNRTIPLDVLLNELNIKGNPIDTIKFTSKYQDVNIGSGGRRRSRRIRRRMRRRRSNRRRSRRYRM